MKFTFAQSTIETKRLWLQPVTPQDIHELFGTSKEEEIKQCLGCDDEGLAFFKDMHLHGMQTHRISMRTFLLLLKETNLPIGECGFHTWNATHHRSDVFYFLRSNEHKQKGLMTEALQAVLQHGYSAMQLHRVQAYVAKENEASINLLKHFHFQYEGCARQDYCIDGVNTDSLCYSLLKQEYESYYPIQ